MKKTLAFTGGAGSATLGNERGLALGISLIILLILSLLMPVLLNFTGQETGRSVLFRDQRTAFYAAERAVEYAVNRDLLLSMAGSENLITGTDAGGVTHKTHIDVGETLASGGGILDAGLVVDRGPGELPASLSGKYGSNYAANYYDISVTALGPQSTTARIETQYVRLFSADDDAVFVTTGGN